MPTLRAIVAEMLLRAPGDALGREEAISSLTTTTAVSSALATGTVSSQKYVNKWLWRPDTGTAADRFRVCSAFTASTGTLTHAGTNYADTTATNEYIFILEYEPTFYIDAIRVALSRLRYLQRVNMPTVKSATMYWLPSSWSWIRGPGDVDAVVHCASPILSRNRRFEHWGALAATGGTLVADDWAVSGSGATYVRSTTTRTGRYSASLTRATNNVTLSQTVSLLHNGVLDDSLEGKTITIVGVGQTSTASQLRFTVTAGATSDSSDYHTGGGDWEELTASITVPTAATSITIQAEVNGSDGTALVDDCYLFEGSAVTDAIRRDVYAERFLDKSEYQWVQGSGALGLEVPVQGRGGQYVLYTGRPYPSFDSARILAGSGDSDSTDAPKDIVAIGAIGRLFEGLAGRHGEDASKYARLANEYNSRFERMALSHRGSVRQGDGIPTPAHRLMAVPAARW